MFRLYIREMQKIEYMYFGKTETLIHIRSKIIFERYL
jgi:hypothetical protein